MKRLSIVMMTLLLFVSATALADAADVGKNLRVQSFQFKHKQAEKAAAVIKPLMSAEGSMSIQPAANSLIVTDQNENLKKIAAALAQFDTAPQPFRLNVRLVSAGRIKGEEKRIDPNLSDVAPNFEMLRFNVLEPLRSTEVTGKEGDAGLLDLGTYRADFKFGEFDPASDSLKVSDFRMSRLEGDQLAPLMKTTLNLKLGQTVIIGVTKQAQSPRALFIILTATR
jgi:hypothetical protein